MVVRAIISKVYGYELPNVTEEGDWFVNITLTRILYCKPWAFTFAVQCIWSYTDTLRTAIEISRRFGKNCSTIILKILTATSAETLGNIQSPNQPKPESPPNADFWFTANNKWDQKHYFIKTSLSRQQQPKSLITITARTIETSSTSNIEIPLDFSLNTLR